jgi:hypothetical protein
MFHDKVYAREAGFKGGFEFGGSKSETVGQIGNERNIDLRLGFDLTTKKK